ncbi:hypothetical protein Hypma_000746 [Hypsizygus marmoreus]|uniref:Transmembrane protein n=1 Tax=Hypsizygus marmoreus TaxID=39966 RepID=A0A369JGP0_HYPMA|nr:hypothetical protein Hypma_000746 [Hypsizygus marmoreus]
MDTLRRRVPFKSSDLDDAEEDIHILDEQEQENLIQSLKETNITSNKRYLFALRAILVLSLFLQILSFYENPLLVMVPLATPGPNHSLPLPKMFTLLSIVLHTNLVVFVFLDDIRNRFQLSDADFHPLSFQLSYVLAAVAPTLSLFLRRPWQSTIWWTLTELVVFTVQTVMELINEGNESISELEAMRYVAPGA